MSETDPTTTRPTRNRAVKVLACYVWLFVLATSVLAVALITPAIPRGPISSIDKLDFYLSAAMFQLLWIWSLISERLDRYDLRKVRFFRRAGLLTQAAYLTILTIGLWNTPQRHHAAIAAFSVALAMLMWRALAAATALHPDDQKVIDKVIEEEHEMRAQHRQAELAQLREGRLHEALRQVRRFTAVEPAPEPAAVTPPINWNIPKGSHTPVVYFIRNGNRIKIGTTADLHQRVRRLSLRMDNVALILIGNRDLERSMHRQFNALRVGNSEWFRDAEPLSRFITEQVDRLTTPSKGSDSNG